MLEDRGKPSREMPLEAKPAERLGVISQVMSGETAAVTRDGRLAGTIAPSDRSPAEQMVRPLAAILFDWPLERSDVNDGRPRPARQAPSDTP